MTGADNPFDAWPSPPAPASAPAPLKKLGVDLASLLDALSPPVPEQPTIRTATLVRAQTFEARRAGETHAFTKKRKKNRIRNKLAKASRKR